MESTVKQHTRRNKSGTTSIVKQHQRHIDPHAIAEELARLMAGQHPQTGEPLHKQPRIQIETGKRTPNDESNDARDKREKHKKPSRRAKNDARDERDASFNQMSIFEAMKQQEPQPVPVEPDPVTPQPEPEPVAKPEPEPEAVAQPEPETVTDSKPKRTTREKQPRDTGVIRGQEREYVDVGEKIGGARKDEDWSNGRANFQTIDWAEMKRMPEQAAGLITKKNLLGHLTPELLKQNGMDANAAWLVTGLLRMVAATPRDNNDARFRYAKAADRLMRAMSKVRSVADVETLIAEMAEEAEGIYGDANLVAEYQKISNEQRLAQVQNLIKTRERESKGRLWTAQTNIMRYIANKTPRVYESDPDYIKAKSEEKQLYVQIQQISAEQNQIARAIKESHQKKLEIAAEIRKKNAADDHSWNQCYDELGDKFYVGIIQASAAMSGASAYSTDKRFNRKSALIENIARARDLGASDWSWAETASKDSSEQKQKSQDGPYNLPAWTRKAPENYERSGGSVDFGTLSKDNKIKPEGLMKAFGLRAVEYGNWVNESEGAHHTQRAGEAFLDLADVLGLKADQIGYGGRLALAIGARGKGLAGAAAHYEPDRKVINITKINGGGSLAHEWSHFMDNILAMVASGGEGGQMSFLTAQVQALALRSGDQTSKAMPGMDAKVLQAMVNVQKAIHDGDVPMVRAVKPDPKKTQYYADYKEKYYQELIAEHGAQNAFNHLQQKMIGQIKDNPYLRDAFLKNAKKMAQWFANKTGQEIYCPTGVFTSNFKFSAIIKGGDYHSNAQELFARAFESFIEDKLKEKKMRNSYLVDGASVPQAMKYDHPVVGKKHFAYYPSGDERQTINQAMENLMTAIAQSDMLQKGMRMTARTPVWIAIR